MTDRTSVQPKLNPAVPPFAGSTEDRELDHFAVGYRLGWSAASEVEYRRGFEDCDAGWHDALRPALQVISRSRTDAEIKAARELHHGPCPKRCRRCSQCAHSIAYWGRGGRDWLGVDAEAALHAVSSTSVAS